MCTLASSRSRPRASAKKCKTVHDPSGLSQYDRDNNPGAV